MGERVSKLPLLPMAVRGWRDEPAFERADAGHSNSARCLTTYPRGFFVFFSMAPSSIRRCSHALAWEVDTSSAAATSASFIGDFKSRGITFRTAANSLSAGVEGVASIGPVMSGGV